MIYIELDGNPPTKTAQQKGVSTRGGFVRFYEKADVTEAKMSLARKIAPYRPKEPLKGPVYIKIEWRFELKRCKRRAWKVTRPDLDNLEKGLLDVLTDLHFWVDDAQVCMKSTCKKEVPPGEGKLMITIGEVENG